MLNQYFVYFVGVVSAVDENSARGLAREFLHKHGLHQITVNNVQEIDGAVIGRCLELNKKESK